MKRIFWAFGMLAVAIIISVPAAFCGVGDLFAARSNSLGRDVFRIDRNGVCITSGVDINRRAVAVSTTAGVTDHLVAVTDTAAARTVTLPASSLFLSGQVLEVKDESGGAATHNITVAAAGTDTIDGAARVTIATNYGSVRLYRGAAGKWFTH